MSNKKSSGSQNIPINFEEESAGQQGAPSTEPESATENYAGEAQVENSFEEQQQEGGAYTQSSSHEQSSLFEAQQQIATLKAEKQALYEQVLRRQAEFDNFRKRLERERLDSYDRIRAETLKQLLPIVDNFERALKHAPVRDDEQHDGGLRAGVDLIYRQLLDLLTRAGLEPVPALGQPFDPHLHEAVTTTPTDEHPENTVLEELQRGYLLNGKLLRPAIVRVAVKKG